MLYQFSKYKKMLVMTTTTLLTILIILCKSEYLDLNDHNELFVELACIL